MTVPKNGNSIARDEALAADLVKSVREIAPLLTKNAAQGEQDRRVVQESFEAMKAAGLLKVLQPRRYGGHEAPMRTIMAVSAAAAEADGGTAWVLTLANLGAWLTGLFPLRAQDEVFGPDPDVLVTGVIAPTARSRKVDGGWRISGKWYYNSGSGFSSWAILGLPICDENGRVVNQGLALVPGANTHIEDTWFVAGMKSSASNCLVAEDVFVPEHRVIMIPPLLDGRVPSENVESEPLYRSAFVPVLSLILASPQLGLGRAALNYVIEKSSVKPISYTFFERQKDSVAFQLNVARAARLVETAHLHAYRGVDDIDLAARLGNDLDTLQRARIRVDTSAAVDSTTQAIEILLTAHGAGSFADSNPLQRIWRDSAVAARHAAVTSQTSYEVYGKALLGMENNVTPLR